MRRFLISLFFVLIVFLAGTSEAKKLALLVGVDDYDGAPSLKCCVNDMQTLKKALMKVGFEEDDIQVLTTGGKFRDFPTKKKIEQRIAEILSRAKSSDMVFFAFSGHGAQDGQKVYFCPPDVETDDLEGTCVSITKVMDDLAKCKAKFKWMVVDACRNDPTQKSKAIGGKGLQTIPAPPAGIALFQSCAEGEESWEDHASGNGYFTKNFAAALSGEADTDHDGKLTLMEVCKWTTAQTKEQVKASQGKSQKPYFSGSVSDFTLTEDLNVPKAKALAAEAEKAMEAENYTLAIEKFDAALALCPKFKEWTARKRDAQRIMERQKPAFDAMNVVVPDNFKTIEEAYAKVKDGGTITIKPGKYELSKTLRVNRNVTFRGDSSDPEGVVINCASSNAFAILSESSPSFQNLTASSDAEECGGFSIWAGTPKLFRCVITSRKDSGMAIEGKEARPTVEKCVIKDCKEDGIYIIQEGRGEFRDCDIYGNKIGIRVAYSGNPTISRCKIHENSEGGVAVVNEGLGEFRDCEIYKNEAAEIGVVNSGNPTFTKCKIYDGKGSGVFFYNQGRGKFSDCEIYGNEKAGIDIYEAGNPTFTKCKIYDEKGPGVFVGDSSLGEFQDCEIYRNEFSGFEICRSGNPTVNGCKIYDGKNCGVKVYENGLGKFSDCEIYRNAYAGIAVYKSGNPTVNGCTIYENRMLGVFVSDRGKGTFIYNTLSNNYYEGKLSNWYINSDAGAVTGWGNTPELPSREQKKPAEPERKKGFWESLGF